MRLTLIHYIDKDVRMIAHKNKRVNKKRVFLRKMLYYIVRKKKGGVLIAKSENQSHAEKLQG